MILQRTILSGASVYPTRVSADAVPLYKPGGVTVDWNTVAAPGTNQTLLDGSTINAGIKFLRLGQVLTKITLPGTDTATITGVPTGGTFTLSVSVGGGAVQTTAGIAFNATAAAVQTALQGLSNVGANLATVTGSAGGPYTISFDNSLGAVILTANGAGLTGGTSPGVTIAALAPGGDLGWFGPYDPAANDGRANLNRGECFILDQTVLQFSTGTNFLSVPNDNIGGVFDAGRVFIDRVLNSGVNAHSLAAGPTLAEFLAAFPAVQIVKN